MLTADEDLRNRGVAAGAPDHLDAPRRLFNDINFRKGNAFVLQQGAGTHAVWAERRRVQLDLNHSHRDRFTKIPKFRSGPGPQRSCQGQHADGRRPGALQHAGTFLDRGPRRHYIVDDHDALAGHTTAGPHR